MTPLPTIERRRVGRCEPGWPPVPRRASCGHPRCQGASEQRHHAVGRGVLYGPYDYVYIDDERVINVIDLCMKHHDELESAVGGVKARLRWMESGWAWYNRFTGDPNDGTMRIYWRDPKLNTLWTFAGFVKGEYLCVSNGN